MRGGRQGFESIKVDDWKEDGVLGSRHRVHPCFSIPFSIHLMSLNLMPIPNTTMFELYF